MQAIQPVIATLNNEEDHRLLAHYSKASSLNNHHAADIRYGSFATISTFSNITDIATSPSSSALSVVTDVGSDDNDAILRKQKHQQSHLSVEENDESIIYANHSRDSSSYSDISSDGAGYHHISSLRDDHDTAASYPYCLFAFIENSLLTKNNCKVVVSGVLWLTCYMFMGLFGGTVAYMHFERASQGDIPEPLPDFGYDFIPYYCPNIPHIPHSNVQSVVLFILYTIIICGVILRWSPQHHTKTGQVQWGGDGRLILQHLFHLNCLVFITRTTTVGLTGLPQPNPKCVLQQQLEVSFSNALQFVMGRGFPPHACGDLIYSGHVGCTLICMAVLHRHGFLRNAFAAVLVWIIAVIGIYFTISCRSHYSVDVVLAFYFGYFIPEWYFNRSDGRVRGRMSGWIRRLEVRPSDLICADHDDEDTGEDSMSENKYFLTISV